MVRRNYTFDQYQEVYTLYAALNTTRKLCYRRENRPMPL